MDTVTRRGALTACAALALPAGPEREIFDEDPRPVFVPVTRSPFPGTDLDTLNQPKVRYTLIAVGAIVGLAVLRRLFR